MARDDFTESTARILAERVAYLCSNPNCGKPTVGPHSKPSRSQKTGVAGHITAASENGPRYDATLSREQRRSTANGIWLCRNCHELVDGDATRFPAAELYRWKEQAEQAAFLALLGAVSRPRRRKPSVKVIEAVLRRYCEDRVSEWDEARADAEDPDKLRHYVEPHYSLLKHGLRPVDASSMTARGVGESERREDPYEPVTPRDVKEDQDDGQPEDWDDPTAQPASADEATTELVALLKASRRLCITEDAGAGKSIFTRRLLAFVCSREGRDALFDGQSVLAVRWEQRVQHWPESFDQERLILALAKAVEPAVKAAGAEVSSVEVAAWALGQGRVLLILDALDQVPRLESIASLQESLRNGPVRTCRVLVTGRAYAVADHSALFHDTGGWRFGRIDGFDRSQQTAYLNGLYRESPRELFPNYGDVRHLLRIPVVLSLVRELVEAGQFKSFATRGDLYFQVHEHLTKRAVARLQDRRPQWKCGPRNRVRWREILAATACEMMVRGLYNYAVKGDDAVYDVQQAASQRCSRAITDEEWELIESVSGLTDRCILEGATSENLCWKHRGMMEFYCGLHLARNSEPGWSLHQTAARGQMQVRCGDAAVRRLANDQEWYWAWRFAIEMSPTVWQSQPSTLLASLSGLFERPDSGTRPNELIYRAWSLLDGTHAAGVRLPQGERVIQRFRKEFQKLFEDQNPVAVKLAQRFVRCPKDPAADRQAFWMGTGDHDRQGYESERPRHRVVVGPFQLQATPVTREQYRLYDAHHEREFGRWFGEDAFDERAPSEGCPMIMVSWYDAWVFARWIGSRLPTEAEWEYACRAGTSTRWSCGDTEKGLSRVAWYSANSGDRTHPVGEKEPNAWDLFDMHGNVWEWCADWYDHEYYAASAAEDPRGPESGSGRVIRGGGWDDYARFCRAAFRFWIVPSRRNCGLGFRLARSVP
jgi:formylglycine-generating enzyme required for sulfatase activity